MAKKLTPTDIVAQVKLLRENMAKFDKASKDFLAGFSKMPNVYPAPNVSAEMVQEFFNGISAVNELMKDNVNPKMERIKNEFYR